jgi:hypothetical protein
LFQIINFFFLLCLTSQNEEILITYLEEVEERKGAKIALYYKEGRVRGTTYI